MRILSVTEMRAIESSADAAGHSYEAMMALAGSGVALAIQQRLAVNGKRVLVLVGPGNNGGDGLVAARNLQKNGANVTAYLTRARDSKSDKVFRMAREQDVDVHRAEDDTDQKALRALASQADVIVDALLGTGAHPPLTGALKDVITTVGECLKGLPLPPLTHVHRGTPPRGHWPLMVAVDGPSGLDFDTGEVDDRALDADMTVTFAMPKRGHVTLPGAAKVGELVVADIGIPRSVAVPEGVELVTPDWVQRLLPSRPIDANKGTFGKALIVAGSANYTGAAILAARAAVRAGTGLVTLATPSLLHAAIVPAVPEATYLLLPHTLGIVNAHAVSLIRELAIQYSAMLIGPGLGNAAESQGFLADLLKGNTRRRSTGFIRDAAGTAAPAQLPPLVVDADGLNILTTMQDWPSRLPGGTVLTPHPGEMSRMTGLTIAEIQANRLEIAQTWAKTWNQVVVLKGAFTVVAGPDRQPAILPFANPGLASAGTGDVLAGIIVALRAQGLSAFDATVAGCYLHGLAGEIAAAQHGAAGMVAGDVADSIAKAWNRLTSRA